jgi:hypothetical protein
LRPPALYAQAHQRASDALDGREVFLTFAAIWQLLLLETIDVVNNEGRCP